ncbi:MAG: SDR family oxidoreductase [Luminiphilus sp.]|nr:SDR family oxidoreductase [Luminiphilus sp.]
MTNAGIDSPRTTTKTAVIAGGTSGIGLATAVDLAKAGYQRLILNGRDAERGAAAVELVLSNAPTCNVSFYQGDASSEYTSQQLINSVDEGIDLFVNAVPGDTPPKLFADFDMRDLAGLIDVHLGSVLRCAHAAYSRMRERRSGVIINIASDAAKIPTAGEAVHGALMAAIDMFSRTLALEAARFGVRVHVLTPSIVINTHSYNRMMDGEFSEKLFKRALEKATLGPVSPEDISPLIVFLASPAAKKMTGQRITVNGGIAIS